MIVALPSERQVERTVAEWQVNSTDFAVLMGRYQSIVPALRHFGLVHWQAQRFEAARDAFSNALSLSPADSHLWSDLSGAYSGLGDVEGAEFCIRKAIATDPSEGRYWLALAGLLNQRSDDDNAEAAYRNAIERDATLADAHFGLGILCFGQRRLGEAVANLRHAIETAPDHVMALTCLGHVYYTSGEFAAAGMMFTAAADRAAPDVHTRLKHARSDTFQAMIEGRIEEAIDAYPVRLGDDAEDIDVVLRDAFGLLSASGHDAAAIAIGRVRLSRNPQDPIQRYLLDAVEGLPHAHAPLDYLECYFDRFAPEFDNKLVKILRYRIPQHLHDLVARHRGAFEHMLDLGCGTGLSAVSLASFGGHVTGVDVSGKMLIEAAKHGVYADLEKAEAVAFLDASPGRFDLVLAADLLVYIGDLAPLFAATAKALVPAGVLALSIETSASSDFSLLPSGRFAHRPAYVERLASEHFDLVESCEAMIRLEAGRPVDGRLFVFKRR